ncbi:MAG: Chromosome partition protein Smc [Elusimicrobia bacterium]|nr:Chromosome partition protein Smc [Elusimicrobiota bacterium]
MHLKHLDIVGFKSFADNIHLEFEPGITAIVGPNGCGKSNIIDAVRWCLGEMSAKSLRSNLMMDVVFNGSGSRPPQNLAEVTLTFDNSDKRLPIDFSDVSITRRLFRSGESEYFINKTQCRLRDIRELFLDTGMGEDGYSSLEQGKVEWILQAKPEERRELFEEAAGVSKYRARREEALRKLDKVEIDLSRLADIIAVTTDQIRKLENAVNKAKTYQRVREELKVMEVNDWLFQLSNSDNELSEMARELDIHQKKYEELNTQIHQLDTQISESRLQLTQSEEELLKANSALNQIDSNIKIGEERLNHARRRQQDIETQESHTKENLLREETRIKELNEQSSHLIAALEDLKRAGSTIESGFSESKAVFEKTHHELEIKKQEAKSVRELILSRTQERGQLQQQMSNYSSDLARLTSQLENTEKEKSRLQNQLEQIQEKINFGENQTEELKSQLNQKSELLQGMSAEIKNLEESETALRLETLHQTEEIAKLKGQIHSIQDQQNLDPYLAGTQAVLSSQLTGIYGPLGRLIQTDEINRDIVAATIGEHLGDLVAESTEDAQKAIQLLQEQQKGRVRIWILDKLAEQPPQGFVGSLPGGTTLLSCIQTEEKYRPLLMHLCSSLWIQGTSVYGHAVINGGVDPSKWQSHISLRLPELEKALAEKESKKKSLDENLVELDHNLILQTQKRESVLKELEEVRIRLELALEDLARISDEKKSYEEESIAVDLNTERIMAEKTKAQANHEEHLSKFNAIQQEEQDNHNHLDQLQHELTELQQSHAKASAELANQEGNFKAFQEKIHWQESVITHNRQEMNNVEQTRQRHLQSIDDMKNQMSEAKNQQEEADKLIQSSLSEREKASDLLVLIQSNRTQLSTQVQSLELTLSQIRSELGQVQELIQNERIRESQIKNRVETFTQKLNDQYEMSLESAKALFTSPVAADPETLEKLKKRVANMGPINLAAPEEHAELMEKNSFLTTQQGDLIKAREDLKQVITKINATTREHFRETFDKVRENFRALYSTLFQGGEADIKFTDESDILNTGIDIFCQPPGKKLLHISLLSGGEKALTAIALLFAFFQVRPSPVALLDEVDAPLDEANVLRYADMIKKFSEKSQFLLISHNKRTMEAANTLYGVTMEELGVSKVLSARLQKKENMPPPIPAVETANA